MKKLLLALALLWSFPASAQVLDIGPGAVPSACAAFGTTTGTCIQGAGAGGTPSSINLTNGTALPLATGVTGTLSRANGGTGAISPPYFSATLITTAQTVTGSTTTKINLNSVIVDSASAWSASNHNYNPQLAGTYMACGQIYTAGTTVTVATVNVSKNGLLGSGGTSVTEGDILGATTATNQGANATCVAVAMNGSTDTLELDAAVAGTGTLTVLAVRNATALTIWYVGP